MLVLAVAAHQLGASPLAVLGFTALQAVLLSWWVLAPQRDGAWILLVSVMTVVFVLGLLILPWLTERERVSGPPALRGAEPPVVQSGDGSEGAPTEEPR